MTRLPACFVSALLLCAPLLSAAEEPAAAPISAQDAAVQGDGTPQKAPVISSRPRVAPSAKKPPPEPSIFDYSEPKANGVKIFFGFLVVIVVGWGVYLESKGQGAFKLKQRKRALAVLGILGVVGWFNFGKFHSGTFVHVWEHYHYYIGAKYFPELRYQRLYECSAIAETELGRTELVKRRMIRDIAATNLIGPTADVLAHPERCKQHFTAARWEQFKTDIRFFTSRMGGNQWERSQKDHGYNGTPWWGILGTFFANQIGPASESTMRTLALFDPVFLLAMFGFIWWAFGVEIFAVGATFFAVNYPSRYWWNGGAFLRYDYLAASIIGICLLKKSKPTWGGALLAYGAALRVFPLMFVVGPAVQALGNLFTKKTILLEHKKMVIGAVIATALLVPLSFAVGKGGPDIVEMFAANTAKHSDTPLTNHMGLRTVMSWRPNENASALKNASLDDPFKVWKEEKLANFREVKWLFWLINLGLVYAIWRATRDEPAWVAAALSGSVLVTTVAELTCYYYAFLIAAAFLMEKRKELGLWLILLGVCTHAIVRLPGGGDDEYTLMSLATVVYVGFVVWTLNKKEAQPAAQPVAIAGAQVAAADVKKRRKNG